MNFLLDTMVLKEMSKPQPHTNVEHWLAGVADSALAISAINLREIWLGVEKKRLAGSPSAPGLEAGANRLAAAFAGRILPIDQQVAELWGRLLARSEKHVFDTGLAATALVHGLVVVTRNVKDFRGRGVRLLDPFRTRPAVEKLP